MNMLLGERKSNSIERDLDSIINCRQQDFQSLPNREKSFQDNEFRGIDIKEKELFELINICSSEMNAILSREMDSLMNLMQSQINRAISSAKNDKVILETQNILQKLPLNRNGPEPRRPYLTIVLERLGKIQTPTLKEGHKVRL